MRRTRIVALLAVLVVGCLAEPAGGAFPGRNGRIAYTLEYGDDLVDDLIFSINPDGRQRRRFKDAGGVQVAFSPHGRKLAYAQPYGFGLRVIRADGLRREQRLTRGNDFYPDWAPGGRRIVFSRHSGDFGKSELRIYRKGRTRPLTDGADPAWSVKGWIAFQRADGIYVIRPDGTGLRHVVGVGSSPDWSPDGRRIVFVAPGFISTVRADGSGLRRLEAGSDPAFSPDGRKIVYIGPGGLLKTMGAGGKHSESVPTRLRGFTKMSIYSDPTGSRSGRFDDAVAG